MSKYTIATTFSGGGLVELGAIAAGFAPILAVEMDPAIASCYADNFGDKHLLCQSVQDTHDKIFRSIEGVDILHGSPVCKEFSVANATGEESAEDITAAEAFARGIRLARPRIVTVENVWAYRQSVSFSRITDTLTELGYTYETRHINAADFGVPQTRKRLILRAARDCKSLPPLTPTHQEPGRLAGATESLFDAPLLPWNGWYDAIADLLPDCPESKLANWQLRRLPSWVTTMLVGAGGFDGDIVRVEPQEPCFTVTANNNQSNQLRAVLVVGDNAGGNGSGVFPASGPAMTMTAAIHKGVPRAVLCRVAGEASEVAVDRDTPAPSLTACHGAGKYRAITDTPNVRVVSLTPRCLARFQTMPDTYRLPAKKALAATVIGNGVSCDLYRAIAESVKEVLP